MIVVLVAAELVLVYGSSLGGFSCRIEGIRAFETETDKTVKGAVIVKVLLPRRVVVTGSLDYVDDPRWVYRGEKEYVIPVSSGGPIREMVELEMVLQREDEFRVPISFTIPKDAPQGEYDLLFRIGGEKVVLPRALIVK